MTEITIVLPLPSRKLAPNARVYWRQKAEVTAAARHDARLAASDALERSETGIWTVPPRWVTATEQTTFYVRDRRRRDKDNLAAMLKAYWDGIADAEILADDYGLTHLPIVVAVDSSRPRVVLKITGKPSPQKELFADA